MGYPYLRRFLERGAIFQTYESFKISAAILNYLWENNTMRFAKKQLYFGGIVQTNKEITFLQCKMGFLNLVTI